MSFQASGRFEKCRKQVYLQDLHPAWNPDCVCFWHPQSYDLIMFFKPEEVHLDRERSLALVSTLEKCPAKMDWEPASCIAMVQGDERLRSLSITVTYWFLVGNTRIYDIEIM